MPNDGAPEFADAYPPCASYSFAILLAFHAAIWPFPLPKKADGAVNAVLAHIFLFAQW